MDRIRAAIYCGNPPFSAALTRYCTCGRVGPDITRSAAGRLGPGSRWHRPPPAPSSGPLDSTIATCQADGEPEHTELRVGLPLQRADDRHGRHLRRLRGRPGQAENLLAQVRDAVSKGTTLHAGSTVDGGRAYFAPAVLTGVTREIRAYLERVSNVVSFTPSGAVNW